MKQFLIENYELILKCLIIVFELITFLVLVLKKNKKDGGVISDVLLRLPQIINVVESKFGAGSGTSKKIACLDAVLSFYKSLTGIELTYDSQLAKVFSDAIEDILSAPQKKGN